MKASKGILYVGEDDKNNGHLVKFKDKSKKKRTFSEINSVSTSCPVFLHNLAVVYSPKNGVKRGEYSVCRKNKKLSKKLTCWNTEFTSIPKSIPFGDLVYCVSSDGTVKKIETNIDSEELKSIKVAGFSKIYSGTISGNGKYLYLIVSADSREKQLIKINIEGAFENDNLVIPLEEIVLLLIKGGKCIVCPENGC